MIPVDPVLMLAFIPAALALNLTPGADMMFCLGQGMRAGARPAILASAGISIGVLVHTGIAGLGLGALIAAHPRAPGSGAVPVAWGGSGVWRVFHQRRGRAGCGRHRAAAGTIRPVRARAWCDLGRGFHGAGAKVGAATKGLRNGENR